MKKVLQFFIFIFILYMIINKIGWKLRPDGTDYSIRQIQALHAYPDNTFEILVYGSSHSWTAFDSVRFQKEFGLNTYNYSDNWQKLNTTYLFIRDSLKKQSPKVIFIETYHIDSTMKDVDMNGEIYYTRAIPWSLEKLEYIRYCFQDEHIRYLTYLFPILLFHDNINNIAINNPTLDIDYFKSSNGYLENNNDSPILINYSKGNQSDLPKDSLEILYDIVLLCKTRGIMPIFYTVPYATDTYEYSDALTKFAKENDCYYINLFDEMDEVGIETNSDFANEGHLNINGAKKITDYLGNYLINHNIMP